MKKTFKELGSTLFWLYFLSFLCAVILLGLPKGMLAIYFMRDYVLVSKQWIAVIFVMLLYTWIPGIIALRFMRNHKEKIAIFRNISFSILHGPFLAIIFVLMALVISTFLAPFRLNVFLAHVYHAFVPKMLQFQAPPITLGMVALVCTLIYNLIASVVFLPYFLGQEIFFRGLLYKKFDSLPFFTASLLTGILWSFWLLPLFVVIAFYMFPFGTPDPLIKISVYIAVMLAKSILISPILLYLRVQSNNIYSSALFQGFILIGVELPQLFYYKSSDLLVSGKGLAGLIAISILNTIFYLKWKKKRSITTQPLPH